MIKDVVRKLFYQKLGIYLYSGRIRRRKWRLVDKYRNIVGIPSKGVMSGKVIPPCTIEDVGARRKG